MTLCVEFEAIEDMAEIAAAIHAEGADIFETEIERSAAEGDELPTAIFELKLSPEKPSHSALMSSVAELPCVHTVQELIY